MVTQTINVLEFASKLITIADMVHRDVRTVLFH